MCHGCLRNYDAQSALPASPEMERVAQLVRDLYDMDEGICGGPIHVQLDDFNLEDQFMDGIYESDYSEEIKTLARQILDGLRPMTLPQRAATVGVGHGMF
jgi:hypothetical protein